MRSTYSAARWYLPSSSALTVKLPDVFTAEILPKLDMTDTLNLAQVNKAYNARCGARTAFGRSRRRSTHL